MYVPKCANIRLTYETGYTSDEDNNSVLKSWPPARDRVVASREKCHNRLGGHKNNDANTLNDLDKDEAVGGGAAASISVPNHALNLSEESREESDLIRLAGGRELAFATLRDLEETFARDPSIIEPERISHRDTILMQKCGQENQSNSSSDAIFRKKVYCQIWAYIRLMSKHKPELLIHRNIQDASALDLASLTDKKTVCEYLARTLEHHGYDPNAGNGQGHTVLHLLARKGDECSDTLEALLALRKSSNTSERLFRIDVINRGHKTPLDVAVTCSEMFSTGENRTIYTNTINLFHDVIIEEANDYMD